jgi:hypothetical protein
MLEGNGSGGEAIIAIDPSVAGARGHVGSADSQVLIQGGILAEECVERFLAAVKLVHLVVFGQGFDAPGMFSV